ncbi:uncharacterized protein J3D65DRAFT_119461 [Phyllosticta citribraziliensis]|uniref:Uncharacterized protein n=1 Tax=Phyllosticta citribraziliensis TaxID=989973 RepID=A0ABR1L8K7_9PEZI
MPYHTTRDPQSTPATQPTTVAHPILSSFPFVVAPATWGPISPPPPPPPPPCARPTPCTQHTHTPPHRTSPNQYSGLLPIFRGLSCSSIQPHPAAYLMASWHGRQRVRTAIQAGMRVISRDPAACSACPRSAPTRSACVLSPVARCFLTCGAERQDGGRYAERDGGEETSGGSSGKCCSASSAIAKIRESERKRAENGSDNS